MAEIQASDCKPQIDWLEKLKEARALFSLSLQREHSCVILL